MILRELATSSATYFFQHIQQFFECIFIAIKDPKPPIREAAVGALRAALVVTASRETKECQHPTWYKSCFEEACKGLDDSSFAQGANAKDKITRDDRSHGSLLVMNELLRCSNVEGEKIRQEVEETIQQSAHESSYQSRYQVLREWSSTAFAKSLRAFHYSSSHYVSPGHGLKGLNAVIQHHKSLGIAPGTFSRSKKLPLCESPTCKQLVSEHFENICQLVMRQKFSRNVYVNHILLIILPRLAAFNPSKFVKNYLRETINYLMTCLRRDRERSNAFIAIGLLALAIKKDIQPDLPKIMEVIKSALPPKDGTLKKKPHYVEPAVFTCINLLAQALGPLITNDVRDLLEPMVSTGLSPALTNALHELSIQIPSLKKEVQDSLLKTLSFVLMQRP